jgi:hypothetical protein
MNIWIEIERVILQFFMHYPPLILAAELLFCIKTPRRKYFWLRFLPLAVILCGLPYLVDYHAPWLTAGWFSFSFLLYFLLSMGIIWFCFDYSWQKVLYLGSAAYAVQHLFDSVQRVILSSFGLDTPLPEYIWEYLIVLIAVYTVSYFVFVKNIRKLDSTIVKNGYVYGVSIITVLIVNVLSQWMQSVGYTALDKVYDALVCLLLLFMQYGIVHISELVKKNITMEDVLSKESAQNELSNRNIEQLNIKCHDLKHQINAILAIDNESGRNEIVADLNDVIRVYDSMIKTGNMTLDVVLTEKKLICTRENITFLCMADGNAISFMSPVDISALFGNALSNAIESVQKQETAEKRHIEMKITKRDNLISVSIENYCDDKIEFVNGIPQTTKSDKQSHGFGIKSIRNIVEKYGGHMCINTEDQMFRLDILFSASAVSAA